MDKGIINNLLKVAFPQYKLFSFTTSTRTTISLHTKGAEVFEVYIYSKGNPRLVVYNQAITLSDLGVLRSIFDMNQTELFSFEIKGIK